MDPPEVELAYRVPRRRDGWELSEQTMPESVAHNQAVTLLVALLSFWARGRQPARVERNLAIRWDEAQPAVGIDPDVCLLSPAPPDADNLRSVRTWMPGHGPPVLAIEVVSETNPHKDYVIAPDKYAASGTGELWIFDPLLAGPQSHGGPLRLQVWERDEHDRLVRTYAGDGPARSKVLSAYLVPANHGRLLRIADDGEATRPWLTAEEAERAAKEQALGRIAVLEEALAKK